MGSSIEIDVMRIFLLHFLSSVPYCVVLFIPLFVCSFALFRSFGCVVCVEDGV